jgi:molybdopterin converting factor subunit 1
MTIKIKFFAILRERAGAGEISQEIVDGSTVGDLWKLIQDQYPKLAAPGSRLLFAVNQSYVTVEHVLQNHDELAIIPPVSGGL